MSNGSRQEVSPCQLRVGTSGYSYPEWVEAGFYPSGIASDRMLAHYAGIFPVTELNYTWYQMPSAPAVERMCRKAPAAFTFAAKLTRTLTHEIDPSAWRSHVARYRDGIAPLVQSRRLETVLVQLPPSFHRTVHNRRYLAELLDKLQGLPASVEFRNASWATDRVFEEMRQRRVTLVAVDAPELPGLFPRLDAVTHSELFYIRFHGRNARGWRSGNMQKQFDYDYTESELREWSDKRIPAMSRQARRGLMFFNNHVRGQAPANARTLIRLLTDQGMMGP